MQNQRYAPVLIPTLNRYEHLKRCVESLKNNKLANETELVISLDYPPNDKYREGWEKIKEYLPTIDDFGKVTILYEEENIGAAKNCNKLRSYVKGLGYDAFILTEDDNVLSPNFLDYMNWGLSTYKYDKSVLAVCGFKRVDVSFLKNNVYKYPRFVAWGYGMWFDRREKIEHFENMEVLKDYLNTCPLSIIFSDQVFVTSSIMRMMKSGKILGDTLPFLLPREHQYCIFPKVTKVRNEGFDGSGLHNVYTDKLYDRYHLSEIDSNEDFVPKIEEDLYNPLLKRVYNNAYKKSIKAHISTAVKFLIYRFTGKMYRI